MSISVESTSKPNNKPAPKPNNQLIEESAVGDIVKLVWNEEDVKVVYKSSSRVTIKPIKANEEGRYPERDCSPGCPILPCLNNTAFSARLCACGCGKEITEGRSDRKYATNSCKIKVFRQKV